MFKKHKYQLIVGALVFIYLFLVYDVNFRGPDEPVYFAYTASIVKDGDLNIINQFYNDYGQYVSKTYNLPDFHNHGGVIFWAPFFLLGKSIYSVADWLNIASIADEGLDKMIKCAMSFSTIIFGFFTLFFTFLLCRKFFSDKAAFWSTLLMLFATPFAYFTLFETGNGQIVASMLSAILIFVLYNYAPAMNGKHWFVYGMFFSICLAVRVELWSMFILFILPYVLILCLSKSIRWNALVLLIAGILPIFILRLINAYLKYGEIRPEELFYIISFLQFKSSYQFNGLFSTFRAVIYSSPIILICFAGVTVSVVGLIKKILKKETCLNECFLITAAIYLFFKLYSLSRIFSPAGDALTGRCFLTEFTLFVLFYGYFVNMQKGRLRLSWIAVSILFMGWNLLVIAEYIVGFDWLYVYSSPGIAARIFNLKYMLFPLFFIKDIYLKLSFFLPLLAFALAVILFLKKKIPSLNHHCRERR